jgi:GT2 family glycosyltransferase
MEITGWLHAGSEGVCLDVRGLVDGHVHYGLYGLDRPDLATSGGPATGRCGFVQRVFVWRGARSLTLEFHDGRAWREFFRTPLDTRVLPASARRPKPVMRAAVVHQTLQYLYRHHHLSSWRELCRETDAVLAQVLAPALDVFAEPPVLGFIENPGYWIDATYDKFRLTGWTILAGGSFRQLSATTAVDTENRLVYPKDRPDVAAHLPDHPQALASGFYGLVDLKSDAPSPTNLKIFATMPDGTRRLAFARRIHLDRHDAHNGPIPIFRPSLFVKVAAAFLRGALLRRYRFDSWPEARREIARLREHLAGTLGRGRAATLPAAVVRRRDQDPYTRWCWHNRLTPRLEKALRGDADALVARGGPLISVVVPVYNTPERYLQELLDCVRRQIYPRWELCLADDASTQPHVRRMLEDAARGDARIKPVFRTGNGHIARATNSALALATGDFVALLDHDDLLPPDALLHVAAAIATQPSAGYLYTDEDKIDDQGRRFDPQFKGGWSPEMAITHNYTHHLSVIRRAIVERVGGLRPEFNGAQDLDLFLRCFEQVAPADVIHVPYIGYHWRAHAESTATRGDQKGYLFEAARRSIAEAVARRGLSATPVLPPFAQDHALCLHQLAWPPGVLRRDDVTIVIPTRNRTDLLQRCLDSIARTTPRDAVRVIIVDDRSEDPDAVDFLLRLPERTDLRCTVIAAEPDPDGFNYSRLVNLGTRLAGTPLVLHLNNDVEAIAPGWLEDMAGWLSVPGVGIVGAKLLHPDETINHAGISLGHRDGLPHVLFEREPAAELGYLFLPQAARNVVAVTGACLLTRTDLYRRLRGFDEAALKVAYNDVDFCLRASAAGQRVVFTPRAVLRHAGSASRGDVYTEREHVAFLARHGGAGDPFHADALDFPPANLPLNPYHQRYAQVARPLRLLVLTHNLNLEGAPIFGFELARYLAAQPGVSVTVASPEDGPLRRRFEEAELKVEIWDTSGIRGATTPGALQREIEALAGRRSWDDAEVFICNTLVAFWGVHLARHLGRTSAWYIHESKPIGRFFAASLPAQLVPMVEDALQQATRVIFTARATREIFEAFNGNDNFRTLRSWVDFDRIEAFAATHDRAALRRKHGLDPGAVVVVNVGSTCERKGQHIYVRAIDQLAREGAAGPSVQWAMVGARESLYLETLREDIQLMGLQQVKIFPETPDIYDFYRLADVVVCTSFEESFPRVLLEAMVFRARIVSTDVNGIPEMLTGNDEAHLVPAGDPYKLATALKAAVAAVAAGDAAMTSMAYARATRDFHQARTLPPHLEMIREAWLG